MSQAEQPGSLSPFRSPVAPPVIAEQAHEVLGNALADALLPLTVFCDRQEAREDLSDWQVSHVATIRRALAAFADYDAQFEDLLTAYQHGLSTARDQLAERVPPLEWVLAQAGPDWQSVGFRLLARLYRYEPGLVLACQRAAVQPKARLNWEAICYRLLDRLHQHEPAPAPSAFVARVRKFLDQPHLQARAALPFAERQRLAFITSHTLDSLPPCAPNNANI